MGEMVFNRKKTLKKGKWIHPCFCHTRIGITPIDGLCYKIIQSKGRHHLVKGLEQLKHLSTSICCVNSLENTRSGNKYCNH